MSSVADALRVGDVEWLPVLYVVSPTVKAERPAGRFSGGQTNANDSAALGA